MNTEHTNQPRQAANAAFEQWWQRHGLEDPMDDEDRYYITASSWARRGYLAAMLAPQAEPVAWVRFCSDGCYEGPLMNSNPAMDGARRTSGAWTPLFAAQPVARDVLMALAEEVRETCWQVGSGDATIRELDLAAIVDRYAAQLPAQQQAEPVAVKADGLDTPDVDVSVHDGNVVHYDHGPNLAEALARLASRIAKVRNLPAPTIAAQQPAMAVPDATYERKRFAKWFCMQDALKEDGASMDGYWAGWLARSEQPPAMAVPDDAAILTHFHTAKDQDAHLYSDPGEVVHQLTQAELLQAARAMLATTPQAANPIKSLIAIHNELLGEYPYCYFELAYTRRTDWMAWLCTKPREDDPERKVLACGQGLTAEEACAEAVSAAQKGGAA